MDAVFMVVTLAVTVLSVPLCGAILYALTNIDDE